MDILAEEVEHFFELNSVIFFKNKILKLLTTIVCFILPSNLSKEWSKI